MRADTRGERNGRKARGVLYKGREGAVFFSGREEVGIKLLFPRVE